MRFPHFLLLSLLFVSTLSFSQEKKLKAKFGKISDEEIAMQSYPDDPAAPAVVLFDKGEFTQRYTTNQGFVFDFERHIRIKIFKKEAYDLANIAIFHFNDEKIVDLQASCYNMENGKLVETEVEKANIFDEKLTKYRRLKKLTIPAVREGSIIEYKYVRTNVSYDIPSWTFQEEDIPVIWSEYKASVPAFFEFSKMARGEVPFSVAEEEQKSNNTLGLSYYSTEMHYIQERIPALKPEPFINSPTDYLSRIDFDIRVVYKPELDAVGGDYGYRLRNGAPIELNRSWDKLGGELIEDVYDDIISDGKTADAVAACISGKSTDPEKIAAIYEYVGKNYNSKGFDAIWMTQSLESLNKTHSGTPTEINLVLINMLRGAKIKAYPVAISTRKHGKILPFRITIESLNRIITAVENEDKSITLIDAAAWPFSPGFIPEEDINEEGLLMRSKTEVAWIPLQNKTNTRSAFQADFKIDADGKVSGTVSFSETGVGAAIGRIKVKNKDASTYIKEKFPDLLTDASLSNVKMENLDHWEEPNIKGSFDMEASGLASVSGNKIYLNPSLGLGLKDNPFKNPERKFPVELGLPNSLVHSITFRIPAGYKVEEAPKSTKMTFGENGLIFEYFTEVSPETVKVNIRRSVKQPFIPVENYADLQKFYGTIVSKLEEQVVLTKM